MAATRRGRGNGLMPAGLIVMSIGLAIVLTRSLEIPRHWTPVSVGATSFLAGAARWAIAGRGDAGPDTIAQ